MRSTPALLAVVALLVGAARGADDGAPERTETTASGAPADELEVRSIDLAEVGLWGKAWTQTTDPYGRLPATGAESTPERTRESARVPSGLWVGFETDTSELTLEWSGSPAPGPLAGCSGASRGFDLYLADDSGHWRHVRNVQPGSFGEGHHRETLYRGLPTESRQLRLYLPHAAVVSSAHLELSAAATLEPLAPRDGDAGHPVVHFGGLDVAGYGVSRPGRTLTALLGRELEHDVVNLGLDADSLLSFEVGGLLAEINASVFIVDLMASTESEVLLEELESFVGGLRAARPWASVLVVDLPTPPIADLVPGLADEYAARRRAQRQAVDNLSAAGVSGVYHLEQPAIEGLEDLWTCDGELRGDHAMEQMAGTLAKSIIPLLAVWADRREAAR